VAEGILAGKPMDWIAIGTLFAALISAAASVWVAHFSARQWSLVRQSAQPDEPLVEVIASALESQPDWTVIEIGIRNRASIKLDLIDIEVITPRGTGLLGQGAAFAPTSQPWNGRELLDPLPSESTSKSISPGILVGQAGEFSDHRPREFVSTRVYAHSKLSRFLDESDPKVRLIFRWRNHAANKFMIIASIIKPNTM
tara:strand:- start:159 stop:752 length:594 start_codon:yes stop_codon:yes gene_type:complete